MSQQLQFDQGMRYQMICHDIERTGVKINVGYGETAEQQEELSQKNNELAIEFPSHPLKTQLPSRMTSEISFLSTNIKQLLQQIWSGDDRLCANIYQAKYHGYPALSMNISIRTSLRSDSQVIPLFNFIQFIDNRDGRQTSLPSPKNDEIAMTVPPEIGEMVSCRAMYWIMERYYTAFSSYDPRRVTAYLIDEYKDEKNKINGRSWWTDYYNASVLAATMEMTLESNGDNNAKYKTLMRPAEALESLGFREDAINYSRQGIELYDLDMDLEKSMLKIGMALNTGLVSIRGEKWDDGEKYHVMALQLYGQHLKLKFASIKSHSSISAPSTLFDPNEGLIQDCWIELITSVYWSWPSAVSPWQYAQLGSPTAIPFNEELNVMLTIQALMVQAGWKHGDDDGWFKTFSIDVYGLPRKFLKKQYRKASKAKDALYEAVATTENAIDFRRCILIAMQPGATTRIRDPGIDAIQHVNGTDHLSLQSAQKRVRDYVRLQDRMTSEKTARLCFVCKKIPETLKWCPCKVVGYCGPDCQKSHWKEHKKTCAYQMSKTTASSSNQATP